MTNLPLPRYVSLKGGEGNARRGPSLSHRIDWVFRHAGMPLRVVAEFGRQPWIIEGVLPTAAAVSSLSASTVLITLLCFIAIYTVLFIVEMGLMLKAIRKGPDPDHEPEAPLVPEKLVAAE